MDRARGPGTLPATAACFRDLLTTLGSRRKRRAQRRARARPTPSWAVSEYAPRGRGHAPCRTLPSSDTIDRWNGKTSPPQLLPPITTQHPNRKQYESPLFPSLLVWREGREDPACLLDPRLAKAPLDRQAELARVGLRRPAGHPLQFREAARLAARRGDDAAHDPPRQHRQGDVHLRSRRTADGARFAQARRTQGSLEAARKDAPAPLPHPLAHAGRTFCGEKALNGPEIFTKHRSPMIPEAFAEFWTLTDSRSGPEGAGAGRAARMLKGDGAGAGEGGWDAEAPSACGVRGGSVWGRVRSDDASSARLRVKPGASQTGGVGVGD